MKYKEFGSDFHYVNDKEFRTPSGSSPFFEGVDLFFSGRSALRALLQHGIKEFHWKKLYVPSYYCHEVYNFIDDLSITLEFYDCNAYTNTPPSDITDDKRNVVLAVNYFGISAAQNYFWDNVVTIEDVTHDLNRLHTSTADYVFGSLRKELPVPVGGFVKSKIRLPQLQWSLEAERAALLKLSGMVLKGQYLEGQFTHKSVFRDLLTHGEEAIENLNTHGALPTLIEDSILSLQVENIKEFKQRNNCIIKEHLKTTHLFQVMQSTNDSEFGLVLKFKDVDVRNRFRLYLIQHLIYPAVLWPGQTTPADKMVENTILYIHTDFRYSVEDMEYLSTIINDFNADV